MRQECPDRGGAAGWEVARPARRSQVPGVRMAGFRDRGVTPAGQRAIPHPAVTLALAFGAGPLVAEDAAGRQLRGSLVAGLGFGSGALRVRGQGFEAVQVRLSPLVAGAVLGVPPGDLGGAPVPLDDVWGRPAARVREQLDAASSWEERFAVTDAFLADRWRASSSASSSASPFGGLAVDPEVARAWKQLVAGRGRVRVGGLAAEVGWSRRRLWSRFRAQLGVPPKHAAVLVRFDHAVHRLVAGGDPAGVAADCGYADQSHLHHDVVALTGLTPVTVAREPWLAVDGAAWGDQGRR